MCCMNGLPKYVQSKYFLITLVSLVYLTLFYYKKDVLATAWCTCTHTCNLGQHTFKNRFYKWLVPPAYDYTMVHGYIVNIIMSKLKNSI